MQLELYLFHHLQVIGLQLSDAVLSAAHRVHVHIGPRETISVHQGPNVSGTHYTQGSDLTLQLITLLLQRQQTRSPRLHSIYYFIKHHGRTMG
jgi:hypothetical protein